MKQRKDRKVAEFFTNCKNLGSLTKSVSITDRQLFISTFPILKAEIPIYTINLDSSFCI